MNKKLRDLIVRDMGFRQAQGSEVRDFTFIAYHLAKKVGSTKRNEEEAREDCVNQLEEYYDTVYKVLNPICEAVENPSEEEDGEGWTEEGGEDEEG